MNQHKLLGLGLGGLLLLLAVPVKGQPTLTTWMQRGLALAQSEINLERPEVALTLALDQRVVTTDAEGQETVDWQPLEGDAIAVSPGDWLRYRLQAENAGTQAAQAVGLEQPIPPQMVYVLGSAAVPPGNAITYSIDGGDTFVEQPLVEVVQPDGTITLEPAPAEAYTHLRWQFEAALLAGDVTQVSYQVRVR